MNDSTENYYSDNTRISNSSLGWFINNGPLYFRRKLDGEIPNESTQAMDRGTRIHEYILQPDEFDKDYVVFDGERPSSAQQIAFCQRLARSVEIEPQKRLLDAYKYAYSIVGKSEQKMLADSQEMAEKYASYIESLEDKREKLTPYQMEHLNKILDAFSNHKAANELVSYNNSNPYWEEHHEFHINWECNRMKCKSLLDCVKFNFEQKVCQIIDLKTTTKLWHFEDSIEQYDYLRQLCFYSMAAKWYLVNERGLDVDDVYGRWEFEFYIIAIDGISKTPEIRVFKIPSKVVQTKINIIVDTMIRIRWHTKMDYWCHTKEYWDGDGTETLELEANE